MDPDAILRKPISTVRRWLTFSNEYAAFRAYRRDEATWRASQPERTH